MTTWQERLRRDLVLQEIVDSLSRECVGQSAQQVRARLTSAIDGLDVSDLPRNWMETAVAAISLGDSYVVSVASWESARSEHD